MINSICFIPSLLSLSSKSLNDFKVNKMISFFDLFSMIFQISSIICWSIWYGSFFVFLSLVLISCCWWENYVNDKSKRNLIVYLVDAKEDLKESKFITYALISIWNMILMFSLMLLIFYVEHPEDSVVNDLFIKFSDAFNQTYIANETYIINETYILSNNITNITGDYINDEHLPATKFLIYYLICFHLAFVFGFISCKIQMQKFGFALPLQLAGPTTICIVTVLCYLRFQNICSFGKFFGTFDYFFWYSDDLAHYRITFVDCLLLLFYILTFLSQIWLTIHIWQTKTPRMAQFFNLFVRPGFSSAFIDHSMMLNRRIVYDETHIIDNNKKILKKNYEDTIKIYACATMWHETSEEMMQLLKSIMRMDIDQFDNLGALALKKYLKPNDYYYEFESEFSCNLQNQI